jgi:hypothetical protein
MSGGAAQATGEPAESVEPGQGLPPRRRRRRRWMIVALIVLLIAAGAAAIVGGVFDRGRGGNGSGDNGSATSLATVARRTLSQTTQFNGRLGYAGSYTVLAQTHGTVTALPKAGQVIEQGHVLYRVDGVPVVLLYGATPAYRSLAEGASAADVTGADVAQLNHDLVALRYMSISAVDWAWNEFSWATTSAVEKLQKHLGVEQTGQLELGHVVFLPTAARITSVTAQLGGPAGGPVLQASSTTRTVSVALSPDLTSEVKAGDPVTVTLPDGRSTPGTVASVGTVATVSSNNSGEGDTGPTVPVHIRLTHPGAAGRLDQALVQVAITDRTVRHVLAVPVYALVALAGGGYAVEVVNSGGAHQLVRVTLGLFDDAAGLVQVSGSGLAAGQRVVVPGQ